MSHPAPRRHAVKLRHGLVSPAIAVSPAPTFTVALRCAICPPPAPSAKRLPTASSATPGHRRAVLHFVARRRLPVVKRTVALAERLRLQDQNRATCCIAHPFGGYAANPATSHLVPAPFRRSHTAKANPLCGIASQKQTRSALRVCWLESARVLAALDCTPPGRGKSLRD